MNAQQIRVIFSGLTPVLLFGCLAPPPNCADPNAPNAANAATGTTAAAATGAAATTDPGDLSKPLVVWNGDDVSPTAKQWADCDTKPCTASLEPAPKVGANGSIGLENKVKVGKGYAGFGWNWTSWYAAGATNITGRKNLKFQFKLVSASAELAPAGDSIRVGLRCAKQDKCGKEIGSIVKYDPKATDGQWHQITIPLGDMKVEDKGIWDDASAWELGIHSWAPVPREFTVYIDDITFE